MTRISSERKNSSITYRSLGSNDGQWIWILKSGLDLNRFLLLYLLTLCSLSLKIYGGKIWKSFRHSSCQKSYNPTLFHSQRYCPVDIMLIFYRVYFSICWLHVVSVHTLSVEDRADDRSSPLQKSVLVEQQKCIFTVAVQNCRQMSGLADFFAISFGEKIVFAFLPQWWLS